MAATLAEAQTKAVEAETAHRQVATELEHVRSTLQSQLDGLQAKHAEGTAGLLKEAAAAKEAADAAKRFVFLYIYKNTLN